MSFWRGFFNDKLHATGDLKKSDRNIEQLVDKAVDAAINNDIGRETGARRYLGEATHTSQDRPFHNGMNIFKHIGLSIASWFVKLFTGETPDFDPDKMTGAKEKEALANDKSMVYDAFSTRLREKVTDPAKADEIERKVKGKDE